MSGSKDDGMIKGACHGTNVECFNLIYRINPLCGEYIADDNNRDSSGKKKILRTFYNMCYLRKAWCADNKWRLKESNMCPEET